jgi:hypothetical protein
VTGNIPSGDVGFDCFHARSTTGEPCSGGERSAKLRIERAHPCIQPVAVTIGLAGAALDQAPKTRSHMEAVMGIRQTHFFAFRPPAQAVADVVTELGVPTIKSLGYETKEAFVQKKLYLLKSYP